MCLMLSGMMLLWFLLQNGTFIAIPGFSIWVEICCDLTQDRNGYMVETCCTRVKQWCYILFVGNYHWWSIHNIRADTICCYMTIRTFLYQTSRYWPLLQESTKTVTTATSTPWENVWLIKKYWWWFAQLYKTHSHGTWDFISVCI